MVDSFKSLSDKRLKSYYESIQNNPILKQVKELLDKSSPRERGLILSCLLEENNFDDLKFLKENFVYLPDEEKSKKIIGLWEELKRISKILEEKKKRERYYDLTKTFILYWRWLDENSPALRYYNTLQYGFLAQVFNDEWFTGRQEDFRDHIASISGKSFKFKFQKQKLENLLYISGYNVDAPKRATWKDNKTKEIIQLYCMVDECKDRVNHMRAFSQDLKREFFSELDKFYISGMDEILRTAFMNEKERQILSQHYKKIVTKDIQELLKDTEICGENKMSKNTIRRFKLSISGHLTHHSMK